MEQKVNVFGPVGRDVNVAGRDITTATNQSSDITKVLDELKALKELFESASISEEDKESIVDNIEVIEEQVSAEKPKKARIKNAWDSIVNVCSKLPALLSQGEKIKEAIEKVAPYIVKIVSKF